MNHRPPVAPPVVLEPRVGEHARGSTGKPDGVVATEDLLEKTLQLLLRRLAAELNEEIDWRARGYRRNFIVRAAIYTAAMGRDIARIPLHHRAGIGQARFRNRIRYITDDALPVLRFFEGEYPLGVERKALLREATGLLEDGVRLISDGRIPVLDEWYATMEEFHRLTGYCREAAGRLEQALGRTADG